MSRARGPSIPPEGFLAAYPEPIAALAHALRAAVRDAVPEAIEGVRAGWRLIGYDVPRRRGKAYFAFVAPEAEHVHLGFEYGAWMRDPDGVLLGRGTTRQVRWLTYRPGDRVDPNRIAPLLREAARLALLPRAQRLWAAADPTLDK